MYIYKITNTINNKIYIGQTVKSILHRQKRHIYAFSSKSKRTALNSAIVKYGKNNFIVEEVDTAQNIDELNIKEKYYIKFYKSLSPNGYNLTTGGNNKLLSDETKLKISLANKGKYVTDETKLKLSLSHKGFVVSDITKNKLSLINKGKKAHLNTYIASKYKNSGLFIIKKYDIYYVIRNMKLFCIQNNLLTNKISLLCNNKLKKYKDFILIKNYGKMTHLNLSNNTDIIKFVENDVKNKIVNYVL